MKYSLFFLLDQYDTPAPDIFEQVRQQSLLAEKLNYHGIYLAEHHIENFGVLPSPAVLLAHIAAQTTYLRLGTAITILPLHSPLRIAEDFVLLDLLSKGRVELGVGSGFLDYEFKGFGLSVEQKRESFDHGLAALEALLTQQEITLTDKHFHSGERVKLNIPTYDNRDLPLYVAGVTVDSAYYIGKQGRNLMAVPFNRFSADEGAPQQIINNYQRGLQEAKKPSNNQQLIMSFFCHVAETDQQARDNIAEAFGRYVTDHAERSDINYSPVEIYDQWLAKGFLLAGSVETVTKKLKAYKAMGLKHTMTFQQFGEAEPGVVMQSMQRFAEQVMPQLD